MIEVTQSKFKPKDLAEKEIGYRTHNWTWFYNTKTNELSWEQDPNSRVREYKMMTRRRTLTEWFKGVTPVIAVYSDEFNIEKAEATRSIFKALSKPEESGDGG